MVELYGLTPNTILSSDSPLVFTTADAERIRNRLVASRHWSDIAVYDWMPEAGMWRVAPRTTAIPGTREALSGLGYAASARTDSIFIFRELDCLLESRGLQMALLGALTLDSPARRRVILPLADATIPADLRKIGVDLSNLLVGTPATPRLSVVGQTG